MTNDAELRSDPRPSVDSDPRPSVDDEIERLIQESGRVVGFLAPDVEPGVDVANWINVSRFVEATGDENPLYTDVQYGAGSVHHTMLAPPAFVLAVRMPDSVAGLDRERHRLADAVRSLHLSWDDTIRLADTLTGRIYIEGISEIRDPPGPRRARVASSVEYQRGGVTFARGTGEVELWPREGEQPARAIHRYLPAEIEQMVRELESQPPPRGARPRFWGDTMIGETGPVLLKGPLTLAELMVWTFAEGRPVRAGNLHHARLAEFPGRQVTNPVTGWPAWDRADAWLDSAASQAGGLSAPAARGGLLFALVGQYATHWMGDDGFLRRLSVHIGQPFLYGDTVRLIGTVVDRLVAVDEASGRYHAVTLRITGRNQLDELVVMGEALVFLPEPGAPVPLPVAGGLIRELPGEV